MCCVGGVAKPGRGGGGEGAPPKKPNQSLPPSPPPRQVQGVYFRATTVSTAGQLNVVGWVRNTKRGTVEGVAQGAPAKLRAFRDWLARGPPDARVDRVVVTEERTGLAEAEFDSFDRLATV